MNEKTEVPVDVVIEVAGVQLVTNVPALRQLLRRYTELRPQVEGILPSVAVEYVHSADTMASELARLADGLETMEKAAIALANSPSYSLGLSTPDLCPCAICTKRREEARRRAN